MLSRRCRDRLLQDPGRSRRATKFRWSALSLYSDIERCSPRRLRWPEQPKSSTWAAAQHSWSRRRRPARTPNLQGVQVALRQQAITPPRSLLLLPCTPQRVQPRLTRAPRAVQRVARRFQRIMVADIVRACAVCSPAACVRSNQRHNHGFMQSGRGKRLRGSVVRRRPRRSCDRLSGGSRGAMFVCV